MREDSRFKEQGTSQNQRKLNVFWCEAKATKNTKNHKGHKGFFIPCVLCELSGQKNYESDFFFLFKIPLKVFFIVSVAFFFVLSMLVFPDESLFPNN